MKLTTHINLVPRLRESGVTPLLPIRLPGVHRETKTFTKIIFKTHNVEDRIITWFLCLPHHTIQFLLFPKKGHHLEEVEEEKEDKEQKRGNGRRKEENDKQHQRKRAHVCVCVNGRTCK
jgi:hypothetical protein